MTERPPWWWQTRILILVNVFTWSLYFWQKYRSEESVRERRQRLVSDLDYWTAMSECDSLFQFASLNNFACRDRTAAQYDRTKQWKAEKELLREELQLLMEKSRAVETEDR